MKKQTYFLILGLIPFLLFGCKGGPVSLKATGSPGDMIVMMPEDAWKGELGDAVRDLFNTDMPALPQPESMFDITYVAPHLFDGMMKMVKNITLVEIDPQMYTKPSIKFVRDRWANGQLVVSMTAPDAVQMIKYIQELTPTVLEHFVNAELNRSLDFVRSTYSSKAYDLVVKKWNMQLNVPSDLISSKEDSCFVWVSNDSGDGRKDVMVYSFPFVDEDAFTVDYLIQKRDSVTKRNIPGAFENSYMQTEHRYPVNSRKLKVDGEFCFEYRGLWRMEGDKMGGPFIAHATLTPDRKNVIVVEGFVFAPSKDKRNLIRLLEASLYTLRKQDSNIMDNIPLATPIIIKAE